MMVGLNRAGGEDLGENTKMSRRKVTIGTKKRGRRYAFMWLGRVEERQRIKRISS